MGFEMFDGISISTSQVLLASFAVWLSYWILTFIYRITFHPLAKFPGPKLAAATFWYETYYDAYPNMGLYIFKIAEMHKKYGPIVRINPIHLHISDPSYYNTIYTGPGHKRAKCFWQQQSRREPEPQSRSVVSTLDHDRHRMRRAPLDRFFAKKDVRNLDPVINEKLAIISQRLTPMCASGEEANLSIIFSGLTMDIISEYCFGASYGCLDMDSWGREYRDMLNGGTTTVTFLNHFTYLRVAIEVFPIWLLAKMNPKLSNISQFFGLIERSIERVFKIHGKQGTYEISHRTIFHEILDSKMAEEEKTPRRLLDEGIVLVGAGSETTARTLAVACWYLVSNPIICERLVKELKNAIPRKDSALDSAELEQLPFLAAVVNEALRLVNPAPNRFPRIAPDEDLKFGDWVIPRGTPVAESAYLIHTNPDIFPDPFTFAPQRWIDDPKLTQYLVPFTKGSRACLGLNLAMAELYMGIASMFRRFKLEIHDTPKEREVDVKHIVGIGFPSPEARGIRMKIIGEQDD